MDGARVNEKTRTITARRRRRRSFMYQKKNIVDKEWGTR